MGKGRIAERRNGRDRRRRQLARPDSINQGFTTRSDTDRRATPAPTSSLAEVIDEITAFVEKPDKEARVPPSPARLRKWRHALLSVGSPEPRGRAHETRWSRLSVEVAQRQYSEDTETRRAALTLLDLMAEVERALPVGSPEPGTRRPDTPGYYYFTHAPGVAIPWQHIAKMLNDAGHDVMVQLGFKRVEPVRSPEPVTQEREARKAFKEGFRLGVRAAWDGYRDFDLTEETRLEDEAWDSSHAALRSPESTRSGHPAAVVRCAAISRETGRQCVRVANAKRGVCEAHATEPAAVGLIDHDHDTVERFRSGPGVPVESETEGKP